MTASPFGRFVWHELVTPDPGAAAGYYTGVLGWTAHEMEMAPGVCRRGEKDAAGILPLPPAVERPSQWLPAVAVDGVDARTKKAVNRGAKVWVPPTDIPGGGRFSVSSDPQGAMLTLYRSSSS
jgi:hypothetical protein